MKPKPKLGQSRAGKRAPGQTATTISMSAETLDKIRHLAAKDDRTVSNWLRRLIERNLAALKAQQNTPPPAEILRMNEPPAASRPPAAASANRRAIAPALAGCDQRMVPLPISAP